jgi:hypothetical protein
MMRRDAVTLQTELEALRDQELWFGSHYELALAMPSGSLDATTRQRIVHALLDEPSLIGFMPGWWDAFGQPWPPPEQALAGEDAAYYGYGALRLPGMRAIGCKLMLLDRDYGTWALLAIPTGMLELIYPAAYPLVAEGNPWMRELDAVLTGLAARLYGQVPFTYGGVGEEASAGLPSSEGVSADLLNTDQGLIVPTALFAHWCLEPRGTRLSDTLWWTAEGRTGGS